MIISAHHAPRTSPLLLSRQDRSGGCLAAPWTPGAVWDDSSVRLVAARSYHLSRRRAASERDVTLSSDPSDFSAATGEGRGGAAGALGHRAPARGAGGGVRCFRRGSVAARTGHRSRGRGGRKRRGGGEGGEGAMLRGEARGIWLGAVSVATSATGRRREGVRQAGRPGARARAVGTRRGVAVFSLSCFAHPERDGVRTSSKASRCGRRPCAGRWAGRIGRADPLVRGGSVRGLCRVGGAGMPEELYSVL
ncbi:hypothetical protein BC628DRAFT_1363240 [Trametes gibbosa]|nr:hypothetical protein BC628DRAFT_1363240 [Trametes gibbosa]